MINFFIGLFVGYIAGIVYGLLYNWAFTIHEQKFKKDVKLLIDHVYKWAGRATKDGAKNLRNHAGEIENEYFS